jgi:hypothetical protein
LSGEYLFAGTPRYSNRPRYAVFATTLPLSAVKVSRRRKELVLNIAPEEGRRLALYSYAYIGSSLFSEG